MTTSSPKAIKQSPQNCASPLKSAEFDAKKINFNQISRPNDENLVDLERELQNLISHKIQVDTKLVSLENSLYDLETDYIIETQSFGNLIHGIEGYLGLPSSVPLNVTLKKGPLANSNSSLNSINNQTVNINPQQRIFSLTSTTFQKSLALAGRVSEAIANGYNASNSTEVLSDLNSVSGYRGRVSDLATSNKKISPPKKGISSILKSTLGTNLPSYSDLSKSKNSILEIPEWQPPPMKSLRKK